jgi:phospholipid/cholesterol/gamma-HCH transport system substrate-binding protein
MNASKYIKIALFFAVLGIAGAALIILSSNGIGFYNTKIYEVILDDASGLSTRSKVYLAGVAVGRVTGLELNGNEARLKVAFLNDVEIRQDAIISRKPSSLLGTAVLSLEPGNGLSPIIPPGNLIRSVPPSGDLNAAMDMVGDLGGQLNLLLEEFRTNQLALLVVSLETINSIAQRIDTQSDIQLDQLSRILESAALLIERTERVLRDSEGGLSDSFSEVYAALANLRSITAEITGGSGNIGQAIYDDGLYRSILATTEKTEDAAIKLGETLDGISSLIKTTDVILNNAGEVVDKAIGLGISVDTNARYDVLAQTMRAGASIRLDPASNTSWYRVGVSSAPNGIANRTVKETVNSDGNINREDTTETRYSVAVDAELARRFGFLTLRGGIFESTAGLGVDLQPFKWLSLSGEVFNFQSGAMPNLRSTLTFYPFFDPDSDKPWNWIYLRGGVTNALSGERDYFFGGGLRFADREVKGLIGLIPAFN